MQPTVSTTTLTATVRDIRYPRAPITTAAQWYILSTDKGIAKGNLQFTPQSGDTLALEGKHVVYKGEKQFAFTAARLLLPTDSRDRLHYVCTRTTGAGLAMEAQIWGIYGERWEDAQAGIIARLSGKVYESFRNQIELLQEKTDEAGVIAALLGKGCTENMAQRAYSKWKGETLGVVNQNCYRLTELERYGFQDVDKSIRVAYSIADDDERRVKAAIIYAIKRLTDAGDTIIAWEPLQREACRMLGGMQGLVCDCARALFEEGDLVALPEVESVALARDWADEYEILRYARMQERGGI